jgi:hypothetical protein
VAQLIKTMNFWSKLKAGCASLSMDCREASRAQSEALEHPLPLSKRIGLKIHLFICQWCRRYGRQLRFLREAAHDHAESLTDASGQKLSSAARDRIKQKLQSEK